MTTLTKIHSNDCAVCATIGNSAKVVASKYKLDYNVVELEELSQSQSALREYVLNMYVIPNDGMIELPIYVVTDDEGHIQASGVVQDLAEVENLVSSWNLWATSKK